MIRRKPPRVVTWPILLIGVLLLGPVIALAFGMASLGGDWSRATHRPTGLAPSPASHREAIVQVYAARTFGWRGAFAVHTWIAAKPAGAERYTRYEVIGWYARGGGSALSVSDVRAPDAEWYGAKPSVIRDLRGADAEPVIAKLPAAAASYPYASTYSAWPGPNSNTFVAHVAREIPGLRLALPAHAVGKDYLSPGQVFARSPSGAGYQLSLNGLLGVIVGGEEGFELNVLGLVAGVDFSRPAVKVPGFGDLPGR
ncbi:hypothetical protein BURK1_03348 [Burkholderiales bacterium]|nr:hypothetical protein BURK1_03348 [Burkholderiales bacterium]